jgi:hypothetical protein
MALLIYFALLVFLIIFTAVIIFIVMSTTISTVSGAPYVRSTPQRLKGMLEISGSKKIKKMADIGSGDGTIIIEYAKRGVEAHGYEINPLLVLAARKKLKVLGLENKAFVHWTNFWYVNFKDYDLLTIYGLPWVMKKLEKKFRKELKPKTRIISNYFIFPNWKPVKKSGDILLYEV